jgi:hypothetical protein
LGKVESLLKRPIRHAIRSSCGEIAITVSRYLTDIRITPIGVTWSEFACIHSSLWSEAPVQGKELAKSELFPGSVFDALVLSVNGSRKLKGSHTILSVPAAGFQRRMLLPACNRLPCGACPASKNGSLKILPRWRTVPRTPSAPGRRCSCQSFPFFAADEP